MGLGMTSVFISSPPFLLLPSRTCPAMAYPALGCLVCTQAQEGEFRACGSAEKIKLASGCLQC